MNVTYRRQRQKFQYGIDSLADIRTFFGQNRGTLMQIMPDGQLFPVPLPHVGPIAANGNGINNYKLIVPPEQDWEQRMTVYAAGIKEISTWLAGFVIFGLLSIVVVEIAIQRTYELSGRVNTTQYPDYNSTWSTGELISVNQYYLHNIGNLHNVIVFWLMIVLTSFIMAITLSMLGKWLVMETVVVNDTANNAYDFQRDPKYKTEAELLIAVGGGFCFLGLIALLFFFVIYFRYVAASPTYWVITLLIAAIFSLAIILLTIAVWGCYKK